MQTPELCKSLEYRYWIWSVCELYGVAGFSTDLAQHERKSMICIPVFGDAMPQKSALVWCPNGSAVRVNFFEKVPLTGLFSGTTFISAPSPRTKSFRSEVLRGNEFSEEAKFGRSLGSNANSQAGDLASEVPCRMGRKLPKAKSQRRYGGRQPLRLHGDRRSSLTDAQAGSIDPSRNWPHGRG